VLLLGLYGAWLCRLVGRWGAADALPMGWIDHCKAVNTWGRLWLKSATVGIDKAFGLRIFALDSICTVNRINGARMLLLTKTTGGL